jgi:hypothetical protein
MVLFSAACTAGIAMPDTADAAATTPVFFKNSRRELPEVDLFSMGRSPELSESGAIGNSAHRLKAINARGNIAMPDERSGTQMAKKLPRTCIL